jgi:hypothetical protein
MCSSRALRRSPSRRASTWSSYRGGSNGVDLHCQLGPARFAVPCWRAGQVRAGRERWVPVDEIGESELIGVAAAGSVLDGAVPGARRRIQAGHLRRCCGKLRGRVDPRGIRLRNVVVEGQLDISGMSVPFPLWFDSCEFDEALVIEGAELHELALRDCRRLPGLLGNGVRTRRDLDLSHSRVTGEHQTRASTTGTSAVWLCESEVGGRFLCIGTTIDTAGRRALHADRMRVGGATRLTDGFTASGTIRMVGSRIGGSLDLAGARIESAAGTAVSLDDATIGGSLFLIPDPAGRPTVIRGTIRLLSTHVSGQLLMRDAVLEEPDLPPDVRYPAAQGSAAIQAPRMSVGREMTLEGNCRITGAINMAMSEASSISIAGTSAIHAPGRTALDLTNAELRSGLAVSAGVEIHGTVRLGGTRIRGNLSLPGPLLSSPDTSSDLSTVIAAEGAVVDGDVDLRGLRASGGALRFRNAAIGGIVHAEGAQLDHPGGYTLNLHQAKVTGSVRLIDGFRSHGMVVLNRCLIEGRLECTGGHFDGTPLPLNPQRDHAIEAVSATVHGGMDLDWASISPSVDFTNASTTFLADSPGNWPARLTISGFSYDRFQGTAQVGDDKTWDENARCQWLSRQTPLDSGPYEQAARVFRQHGYTSQAEHILITQRRRARKITSGRGARTRRALDAAYDVTVGYGYRPWRVLWLLIGLLVLVIASLELPAAAAAMRATTSSGIVYTTQGPLQNQAGVSPAVAAATSRSDRTGRPDDPCGGGQVRCFSPELYAVDTVIPLISLDQRSTWYPDPHVRYGTLMQWWLNLSAMLGWLLSSIFILSLARLARST